METTNIYILIDPENQQVRYVGKANNISERYKAHLNRARKHQIHKLNWINSLRKKGLKPIIEVIDIVPINDWVFWETYWIAQFKAWGFKLINYTNGGDGATFGNQTSFKKGNIPWNNGKSFSQETKDKISASLLGVKNKPLCPVIQMDLEGNFIEEFKSITEASIKTNSSLSKICSVCKGNRKSTNNFKWKYK